MRWRAYVPIVLWGHAPRDSVPVEVLSAAQGRSLQQCDAVVYIWIAAPRVRDPSSIGMSEGWNAHRLPNPQPRDPAAPNRPRSPQPHPVWLSRSLLWAALLIDFVPILVTTPILISGDPAMFAVIELVNIASGITSMLLGAVAMPSRSLA